MEADILRDLGLGENDGQQQSSPKKPSETDSHVSPAPESDTRTGNGKEAGNRSRPTAAEMANRNKAVTMAAIEIGAKYDRLPTVDEIMRETKCTRHQIYATNAYKEGKIASRSAKLTTEMTGGSITSSERSGVNRRNKADQDELDILVDKQKEDDSSDFVS